MSHGDDERPTSSWGSPPSFPPGTRRESELSRLPDYVAADITAAVQKALGRFGTAGTVQWDGSRLLLLDGGTEGPVSVSVDTWARDWTRMDEASRRLRAEDVARAFSRRRSESRSSLPPRQPLYIDTRLILLGLVLCAALAWIFFGSEKLPGEGKSLADVGVAASSPKGSEQGRSAASGDVAKGDARASRVCSATLTRVFQGGSVSLADVDGFRVEIALLNTEASGALHTAPALKRFVADPASPTGSAFIWEEQKDLAPVQTSDSVVVVRAMQLGGGSDRLFGVVLSFGGSLVDAYFKGEERNRYFHIATALSEQLGATHAAVYARCFDQPLHALGSWFRGNDTSGAITALVYFMGTYARPLHLAKPFARPPGEQELNRLHAWRSIVERTSDLTRSDLATVLGHEGGMATGKDGEQVLVTFPFGDGNRASRASRGLVRVAGLGR